VEHPFAKRGGWTPFQASHREISIPNNVIYPSAPSLQEPEESL
jgi:hypothetical protein